ncbi:MAG TPA: hypothetical protein VM513_14875 [Kofleriaceae bacterium]|jgi:hypothetical protein|nr:hypothetical protein [Kofleriaceae bacterium]
MTDTRFLPASAKLTIGSLDDVELQVAAQYNPKELEVLRTVTWNAKATQDKVVHGRNHIPKNHLEIGNVSSRSMTLELLFDNFETGRSVEPIVAALDLMTTSRTPDAPEEDLRRPHQCVVAWGVTGMRPMPCVIESLAVKYTMFSRDGVPLRAIATVKVKEAMVMASPCEATVPRLTDTARGWSQRSVNRGTHG